MKKTIAINIATNEPFYFDENYRCAKHPKYLRAAPYFTDENAFEEIQMLNEANVGEFVYIEWQCDSFMELSEDNEQLKGPSVWRYSEVVNHEVVDTFEEVELIDF